MPNHVAAESKCIYVEYIAWGPDAPKPHLTHSESMDIIEANQLCTLNGTKMIIAIAGQGYVGLSLTCLLSKEHMVYAVDVDSRKVGMINAGTSPIADSLIEKHLADDDSRSNIIATDNGPSAYAKADVVIIATPTNYDDVTHRFDTSSIESVISDVESTGSHPTIVIKSTVPVGYTKRISESYPKLRILFSPEFLREGHALEDNLNPSRVVVGTTSPGDKVVAQAFADLLVSQSNRANVPVLIIGSTEAEAIKLFANTYLALRVSFFNELDTYAQIKHLDPREIIQGVCLDPRIGLYYNNPSFGYGGYCLPKDSKQLLSNYEGVPQNIIRAIVDSNETREDFIANLAQDGSPETIGIYRLAMKAGSDNFRQSSSLGIVKRLLEANKTILVYEPLINEAHAFGCEICTDLDYFKSKCDRILANRWNEELSDIKDRVLCRDLYGRD